MIRERIIRICDSFMGQRFDLPPINLIAQKTEEVKRNIAESKNLTMTSRKYLRNYLVQINQIQNVDGQMRNEINPSTLEVYKWFVSKEKAIYSSLNFMR
jgi:hypothetical protein